MSNNYVSCARITIEILGPTFVEILLLIPPTFSDRFARHRNKRKERQILIIGIPYYTQPINNLGHLI